MRDVHWDFCLYSLSVYEVKQKAAAQLRCRPHKKTKHPMKNNERIRLDQGGGDASLHPHENLRASYLLRYFLCPSEWEVEHI